jgi:hypothetical protein
MKQKQFFICMGLSVMSLFTSCLSEHDLDLSPTGNSKEQGSLVFDLKADANFEQTRALNEADYRNTQNYDVKVVNTVNENVILECKASQLSANLPKKVDIGSYRIEASYGTERDASQSEFYMFGSEVVTVKSKEEKTVNVTCTPTCGKVSVVWASDMDTYCSDYSVTFGGTKKLGNKTFAWSKTETAPWYVALDKTAETISYTISITTKEEYLPQGASTTTGTATGTFTLERNKAHKLTIKPDYRPTTEGGMKLTITIDESTNDHEYTWEVPVTWI